VMLFIDAAFHHTPPQSLGLVKPRFIGIRHRFIRLGGSAASGERSLHCRNPGQIAFDTQEALSDHAQQDQERAKPGKRPAEQIHHDGPIVSSATRRHDQQYTNNHRKVAGHRNRMRKHTTPKIKKPDDFLNHRWMKCNPHNVCCRPGVVSNFAPVEGTGAGSTAQAILNLSFSKEAAE
jgi:hypothetical protein